MSIVVGIVLIDAVLNLRALEPGIPSELEIGQSQVKYVEARLPETILRGRPWVPNKRVATLSMGARLVVVGQVDSRDKAGCSGKPWYAIFPFGFVCSTHVRPRKKPPSLRAALTPGKNQNLPFNYVFVRHETLPMFENKEAIAFNEPMRELEKGMSLVVERSTTIQGEEYVQTNEGYFVPKSGVRWAGKGSKWSGVDIRGQYIGLSFGWVTPKSLTVYQTPDTEAKIAGYLQRRDRVPIFSEKKVAKKKRWLEIGPDQWVPAKQINEVRLVAPHSGIDLNSAFSDGQTPWFDVDTGEQVVVAYRGQQPVMATLVSSGRSHKTPLGNYPIWAKVASMTMGNQDYEDDAYMVQGVPWVLLFQGHNAFHGAYWHDQFGRRKSHGCINLSPKDARWVFEWVGPMLPDGWTGYLPSQLNKSPIVHVRDSSLRESEQFTQERPIGPPDREEEKKKLEEALARRAEEELKAEQAALEADFNPLHQIGSSQSDAPPPRLAPMVPPRLQVPPLPQNASELVDKPVVHE